MTSAGPVRECGRSTKTEVSPSFRAVACLRDDLRVAAIAAALERRLPVDDRLELLVGEVAAQRGAEPCAPIQHGAEDVEGQERD